MAILYKDVMTRGSEKVRYCTRLEEIFITPMTIKEVKVSTENKRKSSK